MMTEAQKQVVEIVKDLGDRASSKAIGNRLYGKYEIETGYKYQDKYKLNTGIGRILKIMVKWGILDYITNHEKTCRRIYFVKK